MKQFIYGHTNAVVNVASSPTVWRLPIGLGDSLTNVKGARISVRAAGTFRNMRLRFDHAPPAGVNVRFILEKNGADTGLECSITAPAILGEDIINSVHCNVGDQVNYHLIITGGNWNTGTFVSAVLEYDSDVPNECWYGRGLGLLLGNQYSAIFHHHGREWWNSTTQAARAKDLVPLAGTITELFAEIGDISGTDTPPGVGNSRRFALWKNGIRQDGSGGTVDTQVIISDLQLNNSKTFLLPVIPGDRVWCDEILTGSPPAGQDGKISIKYVSSIENQFPICTISVPVAGVIYFPPAITSDMGTTAAEIQAQTVGPVTPMTVGGMIGAIEVPSGLGKSWTYPLRKNSADGSLQLLFADSEVGPILATGTPDVIVNTDLWNLKRFSTGISVPNTGVQCVCFPGLTSLPPPPPNPTGTIIVNKLINPDNGESFQFNAVGLTPNAFALENSQMVQYDNVPVGSGYSIIEIVPDGWVVTYEISNGSPNTNISVSEDEIVTVTVINRKLANIMSGIYKIVPGKRQDTLWLEDFIGTRDVKIP